MAAGEDGGKRVAPQLLRKHGARENDANFNLLRFEVSPQPCVLIRAHGDEQRTEREPGFFIAFKARRAHKKAAIPSRGHRLCRALVFSLSV
jgi:hypothetical protein